MPARIHGRAARRGGGRRYAACRPRAPGRAPRARWRASGPAGCPPPADPPAAERGRRDDQAAADGDPSDGLELGEAPGVHGR